MDKYYEEQLWLPMDYTQKDTRLEDQLELFDDEAI